jgi:hypothetical protein
MISVIAHCPNYHGSNVDGLLQSLKGLPSWLQGDCTVEHLRLNVKCNEYYVDRIAEHFRWARPLIVCNRCNQAFTNLFDLKPHLEEPSHKKQMFTMLYKKEKYTRVYYDQEKFIPIPRESSFIGGRAESWSALCLYSKDPIFADGKSFNRTFGDNHLVCHACKTDEIPWSLEKWNEHMGPVSSAEHLANEKKFRE